MISLEEVVRAVHKQMLNCELVCLSVQLPCRSRVGGGSGPRNVGHYLFESIKINRSLYTRPHFGSITVRLVSTTAEG